VSIASDGIIFFLSYDGPTAESTLTERSDIPAKLQETKSTPVDGPGRKRSKRIRMSPEERERMILKGAMQFFAERGFAADTRELARGLGVSQSLIYKYFSNKQELLNRVYEETFVSRWKESWEPLLRDRSIPLEERLRRFYLDYASVVNDKIWIRIALRSSLAGHRLTRRYIMTYIDRLLQVIARELRHEQGLRTSGPLSALELELVWHLHSTLIYYLIRREVHGVPVCADIPAVVNTIVTNFLYGIQKKRT
jgi:AcrR family transcriptional regulator